MKGHKGLPRHLWYLADAQLLIRKVQETVWPCGFHVALGGGVLNHGYSDHDLDLYVLPLNRQADEVAVQLGLRAIPELAYVGPIGVSSRYPVNATAAMSASDVYMYGDKRVDIFVIKPICQCELVTARLLNTL